MTANLADSFRSGGSGARKTKWHGQVVHSVFQVNVKHGDMITITRVFASSARAQALKVAVDKGNLRANGVLMPIAAIWTHTSPERVVLEVVGRKARSIDLWNSWSLAGVESSWLNSAGMVVENNDDAYLLKCSDGLGEPVFEDLVVRVAVTKSG